MIKIIEGRDRTLHSELIDQMYRMRASVFSDRLGWDVEVKDGLEIDRFDAEDPLYLLSVAEQTGQLQGSVRLLPTSGPNMLRDVFPVLLGGETVQSHLIWESSRFAINPELGRSPDDANNMVSKTTIELLCGIVEVCQYAGIPYVVSVYDARMARIFKAANCPVTLIGTPTRIGKVMTYAGIFEMTDEMRHRLGRTANLSAPVVEWRHSV
jgi:N-acyl-L-homoserine lactone synthetase